jgi:hypothetical protein
MTRARDLSPLGAVVVLSVTLPRQRERGAGDNRGVPQHVRL